MTDPTQPNQSGPTPPTGSEHSTPLATKALVVGISILLVVMAVVAVAYLAIKPSSRATIATAPAAIPPAAVSISGMGFSPATISVKKGQAVVWVNTDSKPHQIASLGSIHFSSVNALNPNDSYSFVFDTPGSYTYHDALAPTGAIGTVVVK